VAELALLVIARRKRVNPVSERVSGRIDGATGPAFGQPDHELRDTHQLQFAKMMGFAKSSTHPH
jgi:hypothetical protein